MATATAEDTIWSVVKKISSRSSKTFPAPRPSLLRGFSLVLDMDNTLITSVRWSAEMSHKFPRPDLLLKYDDGFVEGVYKRPGMSDFMRFCCTEFGAVGVWTASEQWRACRILSALLPPDCKLTFMMSRDECTRSSDDPATFHKPLERLWRNAAYRAHGYTPMTTMHIDDNPTAVAEFVENLVQVKPWVDPREPDDTLIKLPERLQRRGARMMRGGGRGGAPAAKLQEPGSRASNHTRHKTE